MNARDIALKDVHAVRPDSSVNEIAAMMKRHNIGAVPVLDGGKLVGVLTDRDIVLGCLAAGMDCRICQAREVMTANPITISPDTSLEDAARIMAREQVRRLPVVEGEKLVGMLSLGDIAVALTSDANLVAETLRKVSVPVQSSVVY